MKRVALAAIAAALTVSAAAAQTQAAGPFGRAAEACRVFRRPRA